MYFDDLVKFLSLYGWAKINIVYSIILLDSELFLN